MVTFSEFKRTMLVFALPGLLFTGCFQSEPVREADSQPAAAGKGPYREKTVEIGGATYIVDAANGEKYLLNPNRSNQPPGSALEKRSSELVYQRFDGSGTVEVRTWACYSPSQQHNISIGCQVDPDFVLVGGGAFANYGSGKGAFLTETRPMDYGLVTWVASSKDHYYVSPHVLYVYAIGIKLQGISRTQLLERMNFTQITTSPAVSSPRGAAYLPSGYRLIGGGVRVNWTGSGNLLGLCRWLDNNVWWGDGWERHYASPATVTVAAIGILPDIPGFGTLQIQYREVIGAQVSSGVANVSTARTPGWVFTSIGGVANYIYGKPTRLLVGIFPEGLGDLATVKTKDHINASAGQAQVYTVEARKAP